MIVDADMIATGKTVLKKTYPLILAIGFIILATLISLPFLVNPVAAALIKQQALMLFGDELTMNTVTTSFWNGAVIKITGVRLAQPPQYGKDSLLSADAIRVRVALAPLFQRKLVIYHIEVLNPQIHLIQSRQGNLNTDYYLAKLNAKPASPVQPNPEQYFQMKSFSIRNGAIVFDSYNLGNRQPVLELTACDFSLRDVKLPNPERTPSSFSFNALLGAKRQTRIKMAGTGTLGTNGVSLTAKSRIDNLFLPDYNALAASSAVTVTNGSANVTSSIRSDNNYLKSDHHVEITGLKIKPKRGGGILGIPANLFIKAIENRKGIVKLDFSLNGQLDHLKANLKFNIAESLSKAFRSKLGLGPVTTRLGTGLRQVGGGFSRTLRKLFGKKR